MLSLAIAFYVLSIVASVLGLMLPRRSSRDL